MSAPPRIVDVVYPSQAPHLAALAERAQDVLNRDLARSPRAIDALLEIEREYGRARRFVGRLVAWLKKRMTIPA